MVKSFYSTQPGTQRYFAKLVFTSGLIMFCWLRDILHIDLVWAIFFRKGGVTEHVHLIFLNLGFLCYVCRSLAVKIGIFYLAFQKKILSVYIDCNFSLFNIRHEMIYFSLNESNLSQCE